MGHQGNGPQYERFIADINVLRAGCNDAMSHCSSGSGMNALSRMSTYRMRVEVARTGH